jgi:hypothetical protein
MENNKIRAIRAKKRQLKKAFKTDPARFTMARVAKYVESLRVLKLEKKAILKEPPPPMPLVRQQALDRSYLLAEEPPSMKKRPKNARKKGGRAVVKKMMPSKL